MKHFPKISNSKGYHCINNYYIFEIEKENYYNVIKIFIEKYL